MQPKLMTLSDPYASPEGGWVQVLWWVGFVDHDLNNYKYLERTDDQRAQAEET